MRAIPFPKYLQTLFLLYCGALLVSGNLQAQQSMQIFFNFPVEDVPANLQSIHVLPTSDVTLQPSTLNGTPGVVANFPAENLSIAEFEFFVTQLQGGLTITNGPNTLVLNEMAITWSSPSFSVYPVPEPSHGVLTGNVVLNGIQYFAYIGYIDNGVIYLWNSVTWYFRQFGIFGPGEFGEILHAPCFLCYNQPR